MAEDLASLDNQIQERKTQLEDIEGQLQSTHAEYDRTVSDLMSIKKEINSQREERERLELMAGGIRSQIEEGRRILRESHHDMEVARRTSADLEKVTEELEEKKEQCKDIDRLLDVAQGRLAKINTDTKEQQPTDVQTSHVQDLERRLAESETQREALASRLEENASRIAEMEKRLAKPAPTQDRNADQKVMEAATTLVSSMRKRMDASQAELERLRQELAQRRDGD